MVRAAVPLYGFQSRWITDASRFKIGCICRQAGKSFIVALEVTLDAAETGQLWVLLSAGERQSRELMEKVKLHLEAMKIGASAIDEDFFEDTRCKQLSIHLNNGGRIIGLPANPDTARGFTGNVVLDEFAFHRDSDKIWKALFPTISRGYKLRIISTPQGMGNRFHTLFTGDNNFSKHLVDIHQAVADGVPHDIEQLKEAIDDDDAWNQEYLCLFIDEASAWLSYEMIAACQSDQVAQEIRYDDFNLDQFELQATGPLYLGVDIGRKKDLSVFWLNELLGDVHWNRLCLILDKVKFRDQQNMLGGLIRKFNIRRACIDETGIGAQMAEETQDQFGTYRVEKVTFTAPVKNDLATRKRRAFEDRTERIAVCKKLRDDLHSVKKITTAAGNIRFDAERTKDGHADRFWGNALSLMASDAPDKPQVILL